MFEGGDVRGHSRPEVDAVLCLYTLHLALPLSGISPNTQSHAVFACTSQYELTRKVILR